MDTTTKPKAKSSRPQDDFYDYVNGAWLAASPIPHSENRWGIFSALRDQAWTDLRNIYEELQTGEFADHTIEQQARDFYYTALHKDDFESAHRELLGEHLASITAISDLSSLSAGIGTLQGLGVNPGWSVIIDADDKDSTQSIFRIHQSGMTLPGREYYLDDEPKMREVRKHYTQHLDKVRGLFGELGWPDKFSQTIFEFERAIAENSRTRADLRDPEANYHKTTFKDLKKTYASIDWDSYAQALGWKVDDKITVDQPEFLAFINAQFAQTGLDTWKMYLQWKLLAAYYGAISEDLAKLRFEFFEKVLGGTPEMKPIWKRSVLTLENLLGPGIGKLYAERHFPESSKQKVLDMVELIRAAYARRIDGLDWMKPATKQIAQKKLSNIKVLIGYPDKWRDFTPLTIGRDSYIANIMAAERFDSDYYLAKLHEPISRDDWYMNPQTVNAYNDPNRLVICFPAAILQPPFFDPKAADAVNFGGIGTVIGHELTHGFDDQGCQFDAEGNLKVWQSETERQAFDARAKLISDHADGFETLPGLHMRGKLVLGESIADLGGIEIALEAYLATLGGTEPTAEELRTFFMTYASTECDSRRDEYTRQITLNDPHPHPEFRVNGILSHIDAFYDALDVKPGDKLYREPSERAHIW